VNLLEIRSVLAGVGVGVSVGDAICTLVISFMYYKSGTFKREHTLPLIRA
jgi:hypothetical protein